MNKLQAVITKIDKLPKLLRTPVRSFVIGKVVPFAGTASCKIEVLTAEQCVVKIANKRKVQNHIKSVHAAAMALLSESATGFVTGMSVPDDRLLVLKSMELVYLKRASGDMTAHAQLNSDQVSYIKQTPKGELSIPVKITDAKSNETVTSTMIWAWTPKRQ